MIYVLYNRVALVHHESMIFLNRSDIKFLIQMEIFVEEKKHTFYLLNSLIVLHIPNNVAIP